MSSPAVCLRAGSFVALVVAVVGMAGCTSPPPPAFPVSGKVTLNKKPLTTGSITFVPDASKGNDKKETAFGTIGADGTYKLNTNGRDGAPLGWYKVMISPMGMPTEEVPKGKTPPKAGGLNTKYQKADSSGILIEVTENPKPGAYDIELK